MKHGTLAVESTVRSFGRHIINEYPTIRNPILRGWHAYRQGYAHLVSFKDSLTYARHTDLAPFEVICIDPEEIEYLVEENGYPTQTHASPKFSASKFRYAGTVRGGEWDRLEMRFEETDLFRAFDAHFTRGVVWPETEFYRRTVEFIDDGITLWGSTNKAEFDQRCDRIDALYDSIRTHGYLSRHQLGRTEITGTSSEPSPPIPATVCDEIAVCIGRNGDFLFFDGRNRLAIAKLLDLDSIPVWIMVRHEGWQRFRESVAADDSDGRKLMDHLEGHPDIPTDAPN